MKITLITTHAEFAENKRIAEEVENLGHDFNLVDLKFFEYFVNQDGLSVPGITDVDTNIAIFRGIFSSLKPIAAAANLFKKKNIKVFDNSLLVHKYSINKVTDMIKLADRGVKLPKTFYAREFDKYPEMSEKIGFPLIVKLTRTGKGAGIHKIDTKERLKEFIGNIKKNDGKASNYIMQEFIPYLHDLRILVIGGKMFTMKRTPKEGDFRANFSLGGSVEQFSPDDETKDLAIDALRAVDMSVGGVDVLITEDNQKYILEVNHTAGMIGMEEATSENITKAYVRHVIEKAK